MTNNQIINQIIKETFDNLRILYKNKEKKGMHFSNEVSRLVFPMKRNNSIRVSEQELRFTFVETFNQYCQKHGLNLYYSIETPTLDTYRFSVNHKQTKLSPNANGLSANFDLVVFDCNAKRVALIEFKANNPDKLYYEKDFCKLNNKVEGGNDVLRFFIQVVKSANDRTFASLHSKTQSIKGLPIQYKCYNLADGKGGEITNNVLNYQPNNKVNKVQ